MLFGWWFNFAHTLYLSSHPCYIRDCAYVCLDAGIVVVRHFLLDEQNGIPFRLRRYIRRNCIVRVFVCARVCPLVSVCQWIKVSKQATKKKRLRLTVVAEGFRFFKHTHFDSIFQIIENHVLQIYRIIFLFHSTRVDPRKTNDKKNIIGEKREQLKSWSHRAERATKPHRLQSYNLYYKTFSKRAYKVEENIYCEVNWI